VAKSTLNSTLNIESLSAQTKSAIWLLATSTFLWQVCSWGLTIITVRYLSPSDYGLMALAETFVPFLALAASMNIVIWMIQEKHISQSDEVKIFTLSLALGSTISLLTFFLSPLIAAFYKNSDLLLPLQIISITFFIKSIATLPDGLLRRELHFKPLALMNLFVGISRGLLQLALAYYGFGYWALVCGFVYRDIISTLWLVVSRGIPRHLGWDNTLFKKVFYFGIPATLANILWILYSTADNIIIGRLLGVEILGFYAMAFYFIDLPLIKLNSFIRPVLIPYYSQLKFDSKILCNKFLQTSTAVAAISFPMIAGFGVIANEGIPLILGDAWKPLITPLQVIALIGLLRAITNNIGPLFLALGKPKIEAFCSGISVLVLPVSFLIAGKYFGLNGIYASWLIFLPFMIALMLWFLKKETNILPSTYLKAHFPVIIATTLMSIAALAAGNVFHGLVSPWVLLILKVCIGVIVYFFVFWIFYKEHSFKLITSLGIDSENE
jgi:teichuronic acid exporter